MCGIIGYIGKNEAQPILMRGLKSLEYRGYDSAGIATLDKERLCVRKCGGRLSQLSALLDRSPAPGTTGIGHTRWATHGAPSDENAHPQTDENRQVAVVHNGVLENHASLRAQLWKKGVRFTSQTDTEVIAHLLGSMYDGDMAETLRRALPALDGSYALCVLCAAEPDKIFCVRMGSPLIIGAGEDAAFAASDTPALLPYLSEVCALRDGQMAVLERGKILLYDRLGNQTEPEYFKVSWRPDAAEKGGWPHYMLKEIMEQPAAAAQTYSAFAASPPALSRPASVFLLGCGTAYHAALLGAHYMRKIAGLSAQAFPSSEFEGPAGTERKDSLTIAVSQSGETADTLSAVSSVKSLTHTLALTNTMGSTLSRACDETLLTRAGPEIAVASTKAYVTQTLALLLLARQFAGAQEAGADPLPALLEETLRLSEPLQRFADETLASRLILFIGRGADRFTAMEAALKVKEVTYLPCEGYPAGELKHGPIALIEENVPVVALCTQALSFKKTLLNLREAAARGATTVCVCPRSFAPDARREAKAVFALPDAPEELLPIISAVPMQLLAYHMAVSRGLDVDKPRNLAKSVTVE